MSGSPRSSSSRSSASASPLRRLFPKRRPQPLAAHAPQLHRLELLRDARRRRRERRLVDSWALPELCVLRGLVHAAAHRAPLGADAADRRRGRRRSGDGLEQGAYVDFLLTRSRRFFFPHAADARLALGSRAALARLCPMLAGVGRQAQRLAFALFDPRHARQIRFSTLCATLARCRLRAGADDNLTDRVREQAEVVFEWFADARTGSGVLTSGDLALMAATLKELIAHNPLLAARLGGVDPLSIPERLLNQQRHSTASRVIEREEFCQLMASEFPHIVQILLAPFDVIGPSMNEAALLGELLATHWTVGDSAYLVSAQWWHQWEQYIRAQAFTRTPSKGKGKYLPRTVLTTTNGEQYGDVQTNGQNSHSSQATVSSFAHVARPGAIDNSRLCVSQQDTRLLRPGLVSGVDFVPVPYNVWHRLELMYSGGPSLPRQITHIGQEGSEQPENESEDESFIRANGRVMSFENGSVGSIEDPATSAETRNTSEESDAVAHRYTHKPPKQHIRIDLYPLVLQIRVARHDSRRVHLLFSRWIMLERMTTIQDLVLRLGILPGTNAHEISLWLRQEKFKSWRRIECSLDTVPGSRAVLVDSGFCDGQELLVDFRPIDIERDPSSDAQTRWRVSVAALEEAKTPMLPISLYQPAGNDFITNQGTVRQFQKTGNWNTLRDPALDNDDEDDDRSSDSERDRGHEHRRRLGTIARKFLPSFDKRMEVKFRHESRLTTYDGVRATGLVNLGNTCFMNSALQCIGHSPIFREYFLAHRYEDEINKRNPLGSRGLVTTAYSRLVHSLWHERDTGYFIPNKFRDEFIKFRHHFEETRQYDAHEFMVSLLDSLHEDLNQAGMHSAGKTEKEPSSSFRFGGCFGNPDAVINHDFNGGGTASSSDVGDEREDLTSDEAIGDASWISHRQRNESVVVDLFHGQLRSVTMCGTCGERKVTFDPSLFFSLPIPEAKFVRVEVKVVLQVRPLGNNANRTPTPRALLSAFWLARGSSIKDVCDRIAAVNNHPSGNRFILVEVRRNRIKRVVEADEVVENIAGLGSLYAYERAWTLDEIPSVPQPQVSPCLLGGGSEADRQSRREAADVRATVSSFSQLIIGSRVDALGQRDDWHCGTVVEVVENRMLKLASNDSKRRDLVRAVNCKQVCVHFDAFSGKWNKWYTPTDWKEGRIQPLHSHTKRVSEVFEVQVVHRYVSSRASAARRSSPSVRVRLPSKLANSKMALMSKRSLFEIPTRENASSSIDMQYGSFEVFGMPLFVTEASDKTARDMHLAILLQVTRFFRNNGDPTLLRDLFSCAQHLKDTSRDSNQSEHSDDDEDCATRWANRLPYEVRIVNLEDVGSVRGMELPVDDSNLLRHFSSRSVLTLDWKDYKLYAGRDEQVADDYPSEMLDTLREQQEEIPSASNAVPLTKCMDALLKQEEISIEDQWICERCGVPRAGTRTCDIWRLPDLVMVQLKRFQYLENQHKQKVRALVDFPLEGLDFSRWVAPEAATMASTNVYDLYAVANHVGGLARGHYTACCRYDADFSESAHLFTGREASNVLTRDLWLRFDDEKVSEVAAGDVVTDAAYVLFYKRRTLSSSNVLQYAL